MHCTQLHAIKIHLAITKESIYKILGIMEHNYSYFLQIQQKKYSTTYQFSR